MGLPIVAWGSGIPPKGQQGEQSQGWAGGLGRESRGWGVWEGAVKGLRELRAARAGAGVGGRGRTWHRGRASLGRGLAGTGCGCGAEGVQGGGWCCCRPC